MCQHHGHPVKHRGNLARWLALALLATAVFATLFGHRMISAGRKHSTNASAETAQRGPIPLPIQHPDLSTLATPDGLPLADDEAGDGELDSQFGEDPATGDVLLEDMLGEDAGTEGAPEESELRALVQSLVLCEESWWRQCVKDGQIVQPLVMQKVTAGAGEMLTRATSTLPISGIQGLVSRTEDGVASFMDKFYKPAEPEVGRCQGHEELIGNEVLRRDICHASKIHVALVFNRQYFAGAQAVMKSAARRSHCAERIHFHLIIAEAPQQVIRLKAIIDQSATCATDCAVTVYPISMIAAVARVPGLRTPQGMLRYAQFYLTPLLPRCLTEIIYVDSDVLFLGAVDELWDVPLEGKAAAAPEKPDTRVSDAFPDTFWTLEVSNGVRYLQPYRTFDPGVMKMNLQSMHDMKIVDQANFWLASMDPKPTIEQLGALLLAGRVQPLVNSEWDVRPQQSVPTSTEEQLRFLQGAKIVHWNHATKPWNLDRLAVKQNVLGSNLWEQLSSADSSAEPQLLAAGATLQAASTGPEP